MEPYPIPVISKFISEGRGLGLKLHALWPVFLRLLHEEAIKSGMGKVKICWDKKL